MKKSVVIFLWALLAIPAWCQSDSTALAKLDTLLTRYYLGMERLPVEEKFVECDYLIGSCGDSLVRQHVALNIYDHYLDSRVMGEEAVAIHVYDSWFANGKVSMGSDIRLMNAGIFADFNRNTLIGMDAPEITLYSPDGEAVELPSSGRTSVLFFYDTNCSKCKSATILLPHVMENVDFDVDLYMVYSGTDSEAWAAYRKNFSILNDKVHIIHLWDPEIESDYQRLYGLISTPKIYVTEPQGTIIGRRLEMDSLMQVLPFAGAIQEMYENHVKEK